MSRETDKSRRKALKNVAANVASWPALTVLNGFGPGHPGHPYGLGRVIQANLRLQI